MIKIVDQTSNTVFFPNSDPNKITFKTNASNGDTFLIPHGIPEAVEGLNAEDDSNAIASASISGGAIQIGLVDDAGANVTADTDIIGTVNLRSQ